MSAKTRETNKILICAMADSFPLVFSSYQRCSLHGGDALCYLHSIFPHPSVNQEKQQIFMQTCQEIYRVQVISEIFLDTNC